MTAGLPSLLFSLALRHITPATGVTLALCEPVVAFVLSVRVLGEGPTAAACLAIYRIEDGRIAEAWAEWDNLSGLRQLGHASAD